MTSEIFSREKLDEDILTSLNRKIASLRSSVSGIGSMEFLGEIKESATMLLGTAGDMETVRELVSGSAEGIM